MGSGNSSYAAERGPGGLYSDLPSLLTVVGKGSAFSYPRRGDLYSAILTLREVRRKSCARVGSDEQRSVGAHASTHLVPLKDLLFNGPQDANTFNGLSPPAFVSFTNGCCARTQWP